MRCSGSFGLRGQRFAMQSLSVQEAGVGSKVSQHRGNSRGTQGYIGYNMGV